MIGSRQMERVLSAAARPAPRWCWSAIPSSCRRSRRARRSGRRRAARRGRDHRGPAPARGLAARRDAPAGHRPHGRGARRLWRPRHGPRRRHARGGAGGAGRPLGSRARGRARTRAASSSPTPTPRCATSTRWRAARLRDAGELGEDVAVKTERGERSFAAGDRIMFLQQRARAGRQERHAGHRRSRSTPQRAWRCGSTTGAASPSTSRTTPTSITAMPPPSTRRRA